MSSALDRLHPVVVHHIVNTLGWRSLRALQDEAAGPVLDGADALLLAPTAGGKTEAAIFPLLTAMDTQGWSGISVIYVCPLKALLNNLLPRLETYAGWLGRRVAVWHGDITASARQRILREPPDVLLTTPESLEAMLISLKVEHGRLFTDLRAVVVDEVHAFAGDDRGWHLLAVLERLTKVAGRPIQRIGLSATGGNPADLLDWLQGSGRDDRSAVVVSPNSVAAPAHDGDAVARGSLGRVTPPPGDIELDYVGSASNAATVIASLHRGEKRQGRRSWPVPPGAGRAAGGATDWPGAMDGDAFRPAAGQSRKRPDQARPGPRQQGSRRPWQRPPVHPGDNRVRA